MNQYKTGDRVELLDLFSGQVLEWMVQEVFFLQKRRFVALLHTGGPNGPLLQLMEHPWKGGLKPITDPKVLEAAAARFRICSDDQ